MNSWAVEEMEDTIPLASAPLSPTPQNPHTQSSLSENTTFYSNPSAFYGNALSSEKQGNLNQERQIKKNQETEKTNLWTLEDY